MDSRETSTKATPVRGAIGIGLLLAYLYFAPQWLEGAVVRSGIEISGYVQIIGITLLDIAFFTLAWLVLKSLGGSLPDAGYARPRNLAGAIAFGLVMAGLGFAAVEVLIRTGIWDRSPSRVPQGDYPLLAAWLAFEAFVPGVVEEFVYRGVIMFAVARAFGSDGRAWAVAVIAQAVIFSLAHGYNGIEGLELGLGFGLTYGLMFVFGGRNLWPLVITHNVYNVARIAYAYYLQPPG